VSLEKLDQVEPGYVREFVPRPFSLTRDELGELPVTMAKAPTPVFAWVRYPAIATRVQGVAVAWTQRAVYVEWEDRGTHRAWVWASAVEHARAGEAVGVAISPTADTAPTEQPRTTEITTLGTEPLVRLVNAALALIGAEFVTSMAKSTGPFSAIVFGAIDGHLVRLDFRTGPAICTVLLVSKDTEDLPEPSVSPTFEEAIEAYPWAVAVDALDLD
jgi:hypothetical protein